MNLQLILTVATFFFSFLVVEFFQTLLTVSGFSTSKIGFYRSGLREMKDKYLFVLANRKNNAMSLGTYFLSLALMYIGVLAVFSVVAADNLKRTSYLHLSLLPLMSLGLHSYKNYKSKKINTTNDALKKFILDFFTMYLVFFTIESFVIQNHVLNSLFDTILFISLIFCLWNELETEGREVKILSIFDSTSMIALFFSCFYVFLNKGHIILIESPVITSVIMLVLTLLVLRKFWKFEFKSWKLDRKAFVSFKFNIIFYVVAGKVCLTFLEH